MCHSIFQDEADMQTATVKTMVTYPTLTVVLGRFQPLHRGHELLIQEALNRGDKTMVLIGSASESRNATNPFTFDERHDMVIEAFPEQSNEDRLVIHPQDDVKYRDDVWLKRAVAEIHQTKLKLGCSQVKLVGFGKDGATRQCLAMFEGHIPVEYVDDPHVLINATDIREEYFAGTEIDDDYFGTDVINEYVRDFLVSFRETKDYDALVKERDSVLAYRKSWEDSPFPPVFVAVDGLVTWNDYWGKPHLLLIKRKSEVGNGKLALPGGFIETSETVYTSAVREIREETQLDVLGWRLDGVDVFDDPKRSARGRMITHVHRFSKKGKLPPEVQGDDDAGEAMWVPYDQIKKMRHNFFADHYHIITKLAPVIEEF